MPRYDIGKKGMVWTKDKIPIQQEMKIGQTGMVSQDRVFVFRFMIVLDTYHWEEAMTVTSAAIVRISKAILPQHEFSLQFMLRLVTRVDGASAIVDYKARDEIHCRTENYAWTWCLAHTIALLYLTSHISNLLHSTLIRRST